MTGAATDGPVLITARLRLRRPARGDLAAFHGFLGDPRAMRYWSCPAHATLGESRDFLDRTLEAAAAGLSDEFVIERDGRVIGKAGAWRLPELGFILHPDHWRQGLAREALGAVIGHLFATHALARLTADVDPGNAASLGLLAHLGFQRTGTARRTLMWGEEWRDSVYLALDRAVWAARGGS
jgi:RimJ/RimL family protein N-acetyltransferase